MEELVVLVDEQDNELGVGEKLWAHQNGGKLHRAFSVFIANSKGEILLQQRAKHKYHSPLLWTNTCCSHPRPGETPLQGAERRLNEEMGLQTNLEFLFSFIYKAEFDNQLTEFELDHVFFGVTDSLPTINPDEVDAFRYVSTHAIEKELLQNPDSFTAWFKICWKEFLDKKQSSVI